MSFQRSAIKEVLGKRLDPIPAFKYKQVNIFQENMCMYLDTKYLT